MRGALAASRRFLAWALTPITPGARRAVVFLFVLTVALAGVNLLWSAHQTAADDERWHQAVTQMQQQLCGVIGPFAATSVPKPTSPAQKATATQYAWHKRFVNLSHSFRCQEVP